MHARTSRWQRCGDEIFPTFTPLGAGAGGGSVAQGMQNAASNWNRMETGSARGLGTN